MRLEQVQRKRRRRGDPEGSAPDADVLPGGPPRSKPNLSGADAILRRIDAVLREHAA